MSTDLILEDPDNLPGSFIGISCYDWSESISESKNWIDILRVEIYSKEYNDWLGEAY